MLEDIKSQLDRLNRVHQAMIDEYESDALAQMLGKMPLMNFGHNRKGEPPILRNIVGRENVLRIAKLIRHANARLAKSIDGL